jgi:transposase
MVRGQSPREESPVGKTRPPYPRQFREEAVRLARESGKPRGRIAKDLGISEQTLYTWMKQEDLDSGKRSDGLTTEEHAEIRRLRREVRILREEREILRKAAAFFAKETNSTP